MSRTAGILMIVMGSATILLGVNEIIQPDQLSPYARWSSIGLGLIIALIGAAHFRAPHKAFLLSIPALTAFVLYIYSVALFYDVRNFNLFLGGHILAALLVAGLSYAGYKRSKVPSAV